MDMRVKGMFLKNIVATIKEHKGPQGLEALKRELGDTQFYGMRDYSLEEEVQLHRVAMKILYGDANPNNYFELGKVSFQTYAESAIGKTIMSLFHGNVKKLALSFKMAINTISSGFDIRTEDLGGNRVKITLLHLPYPVEYYKGVFTGAIEYFQKRGEVTQGLVKAHTRAPGDYEYILRWE